MLRTRKPLSTSRDDTGEIFENGLDDHDYKKPKSDLDIESVSNGPSWNEMVIRDANKKYAKQFGIMASVIFFVVMSMYLWSPAIVSDGHIHESCINACYLDKPLPDTPDHAPHAPFPVSNEEFQRGFIEVPDQCNATLLRLAAALSPPRNECAWAALLGIGRNVIGAYGHILFNPEIESRGSEFAEVRGGDGEWKRVSTLITVVYKDVLGHVHHERLEQAAAACVQFVLDSAEH